LTEQPEPPQAAAQRRASQEADAVSAAQRQEATRRTAWTHGSDLADGGTARPGAGSSAGALRGVGGPSQRMNCMRRRVSDRCLMRQRLDWP
jgi:hypothetical protein